MRGLFAVSALACLLSAFSAHSAPEQQDGEVSYSYYLISCGNYVEHHQNGASSDNNNTADTFYVAGWLSAYNRLKATSGIPEDATLDDVMLWLEQYCEKNPLSNLETGLFALGEETSQKRNTPIPQEAPGPTAAPASATSPAPVPPPVSPATPLAPRMHAPVPGLKPLPIN